MSLRASLTSWWKPKPPSPTPVSTPAQEGVATQAVAVQVSNRSPILSLRDCDHLGDFSRTSVERASFAHMNKGRRHPLALRLSDTSPIGQPGTIWGRSTPWGSLPRDDKNPDFSPVIVRGRAKNSQGAYYQGFVSSSTYRRAWSSIYQTLTTGQWYLRWPEGTLDGLGQRRVKQFEDSLKPLERNLFKELEGGWAQFVRHALYMLIGGFSLFHEVWWPDGRLRCLDFKTCSYVSGWVNDTLNRELLAVVLGDGQERYMLDAQNILLYSYDRFGTNWEGISPLRSVLRWIEAHQLFSDLELIAAERFGNPWITASRTNPDFGGFDTNTYETLVRILDEAVAEDNPVFALPDGVELTIHSPAGKVPDFAEPKNHALERIAEILKSEGSLMGLGRTGAYAARESASQEAIRFAPHFGKLICDGFNGVEGLVHEGTLRKMCDARGLQRPDGVYPELVFDIGELEDPGAAERLVNLNNAGLIVKTPEVIKEAHRLARLSEPSDEEIAKHLEPPAPPPPLNPGQAPDEDEDPEDDQALDPPTAA